MGVTAWDSLTSEWEDYLRASGAPETTIGLRVYHLTRMGRAFPSGLASVTFPTLTSWLAGNRWQPNTRRAYRASLRSFWTWAIAAGYAVQSPAHLLPPVKVPRARPRPAPEDAYRLALGIADERVRLAILLAGQCGMRRGEIAAARREDMERDLIGWSLRVVGKGGHVRLIPMPEPVSQMVLAHSPGWLFPSSARDSHLTPHHLGKLVSACLPGSLTTHTLRHRCGTVTYAATKDLRAVQELLGHAKPETTALYTQVPDAAIRAAVEAAA